MARKMIEKLIDRVRFWRWYLLEFRPIAGAAEDAGGDDGGDAGEGAGDGDGEGAGSGDGDGDGEGAGDGAPPDETPEQRASRLESERAKARNMANRERKARERLEKQLKERESADQTEHEKALEKAREEARAEALTEAEKDRRADRLEVAVTRAATGGVEIKVDGKSKPVKFLDPEDAQLRIERKLASEEIDADELYGEGGKVDATVLRTELAKIASAHPHLVGETKAKPNGSADGGQGEPAGGDVESMSPEDHERRKYPGNFAGAGAKK